MRLFLVKSVFILLHSLHDHPKFIKAELFVIIVNGWTWFSLFLFCSLLRAKYFMVKLWLNRTSYDRFTGFVTKLLTTKSLSFNLIYVEHYVWVLNLYLYRYIYHFLIRYWLITFLWLRAIFRCIKCIRSCMYWWIKW